LTKLELLEKLNKERTSGIWLDDDADVVASSPGRQITIFSGTNEFGVQWGRIENSKFTAEAANSMEALLNVARAAEKLIPMIKEDCDSTMDQFKAVIEIEKALAELKK
jgi:hypothetical protein